MGHVISITYQPEGQAVRHGEFFRVPTNSVMLDAGYGIVGDRKAGGNPQRHLNLMARETLDALADCGFKTTPGALGEQVQMIGIALEDLPSGSLLQIGDSAVIRLNKLRAGCVWVAQKHGQGCDSTGRLGMMATVIASGEIRVGDKIQLLVVPELL